MRTRTAGLLGAVLAVGFVAAACGKSEAGGTITLDGQKANDHGTTDLSGESSVELEMDNDGTDYYFSPTLLQGTAGQQITVELSNEGSVEHNFTIADQGVDQDVQPDGKAEVTVTFPSSGTLLFMCKYHAEQYDMRGALEVS